MGLKQPESPIEQQIVKPLHAGGGQSAEPIGPQSVGFADPGFRAERLYIDTTVIDKTDASVRDTKPLITGIAFVTTGPCEGYAFVPLIGGCALFGLIAGPLSEVAAVTRGVCPDIHDRDTKA